jgi:DNA repair/transcription protein MET18/MMS19
MFLALMVDKLAEVRAMKADFVFGVIQCIDGEKDPRNLIMAFQLIRAIVLSIPEWVKFEEDLFEVP